MLDFLDDADCSEDTIVAWLKGDEVAVIIPSKDVEINPFLSRFVQVDSKMLDGYPSLFNKANASYEDIISSEKDEDTSSESEEYVQLSWLISSDADSAD